MHVMRRGSECLDSLGPMCEASLPTVISTQDDPRKHAYKNRWTQRLRRSSMHCSKGLQLALTAALLLAIWQPCKVGTYPPAYLLCWVTDA